MLENLALRQQVALLRQSVKRPRATPADKLFWILFSRYVDGWRNTLHALHPDTIVRWHRYGFRQYWRWKSRGPKPGRPAIDTTLRRLIRDMQSTHIGWGAPRIHGELLKLGIEVSQATVSKYMPRTKKPPSQTWRTFLENHADCIAGIDSFTLPTATFRILYVFIVLSHDRRQVVHFNATEHPTAQWTAQQLVDAFPFDSAPRYLLRDRDAIYAEKVQRRIRSLGIDEVITAARSPWQNPYVERIIGSIPRDCLDHVIVLNERHLRRILREYFTYYHTSRTHLSLNKDPPESRAVESVVSGNIVALPRVGGLHHRYTRIAA
ncbi:MAG: integrase core domain-containing protein [Gammaproteobacteria bacterium]|nr:integrase core domain-containing protein [Gammaproteobacteria bacterium]